MFGSKSFVMLSSVITLPILAQITPETAIERMAIGTAQMILSVVVVAEAIAIATMFWNWRKDVERDREEARIARKELSELLAKNTAVIEQNKDAGHRHSEALEAFERSVIGFTEVIRKCEGKR